LITFANIVYIIQEFMLYYFHLSCHYMVHNISTNDDMIGYNPLGKLFQWCTEQKRAIL